MFSMSYELEQSFAAAAETFKVHVCYMSEYSNPVEAACMFWRIFDVACTFFYKILRYASKILHALQNDCSIEFFRKFSTSFCIKSMQFVCNMQKFLQVSVFELSK